MNISQQTNGAHVAATNMTTLLQKNCIKTLSVNNGVVVMGTAPVGNASMINANVVPITGTPLTTNVTATNLQTHTMIANASHIQPIQAFQYQQLQAVSQAQPQYIIYNPNDGSMFRPVVTTTAPVNAIVTNSLYQPQQQQTFVAQNHLPKIGAIKATTLGVSNAQQKVLNIVAPQKQSTTTTTTTTIQNTNTIQHIKTGNNVTHQQLHHHHQQQQQHRPIIQQNGTNINTTSDNIINTTPVASQIISNTNQSPAIHAEAIKAAALVTSASVVSSKAATPINTNAHAQTPSITANNNTTTSTTTTTPTTNTTHVNNTTNSTQHTNSVPANRERKEQPAETNPMPAAVDQTSATTENNDEENEPEPEIDIVINNVVCSFSVRCHLNLREIALNGKNVEFRRENGMVTMKLRRPYTTASIWSSGRITCTGATSEDQAKIGARRYARCLQGLGFPVRFNNFRVVNVLGTCSMPWAIKIVNFSEKYKKDASYEPELHPGVTYKLKSPKATLKIFSTGSITVTAGSVADVQAAIEHIFPLVYEFRKKRTVAEVAPPTEPFDPDSEDVLNEIMGMGDTVRNGDIKANNKKKAIKRKYPFGLSENDPHIDNMIVSDDDDINDLDEDDDMDDL